jgi:truncated hemoglobin YjbI
VVARARFVDRLRDEWKRAEQELNTFRAGPLAAKRATAEEAVRRHLATRMAVQALERHQATFAATARRAAECRDEDAKEEIASPCPHRRRQTPLTTALC